MDTELSPKDEFIAEYLEETRKKEQLIIIEYEKNRGNNSEAMQHFISIGLQRTFHTAELLYEMKQQTKLLIDIMTAIKN